MNTAKLSKEEGCSAKDGSCMPGSPKPSDFSLSKLHLFCDLLLFHLQSPEVAGSSVLNRSELKNWVEEAQ